MYIPSQKWYRNEKGNWEEIQKILSERIETAGDSFIIFDPYLWKPLNDDDTSDWMVRRRKEWKNCILIINEDFAMGDNQLRILKDPKNDGSIP